jgi:hypothetical protein
LTRLNGPWANASIFGNVNNLADQIGLRQASKSLNPKAIFKVAKSEKSPLPEMETS